MRFGVPRVTDNFLPDYQPAATRNTIRCLVRDKAVRITPEEKVRQRVLHWLMRDKGWKKDHLRLEEGYRWIGDPNRRRVRPDIELLKDGKVLVVVECKREEVPLSERVEASGYRIRNQGESRLDLDYERAQPRVSVEVRHGLEAGWLIGAAGRLRRPARR